MWLCQLLPGRDIATAPSNQMEQTIFGAASSLKNFIYLLGDLTSRKCYVVDPCWDCKGVFTTMLAASR